MFEPGMVQTLVEGVRDTLYMVLASTAFGYLLGNPLFLLLSGYLDCWRAELKEKI